MSESDLISFVHIATERGDSLFEYWLTASFALALVLLDW